MFKKWTQEKKASSSPRTIGYEPDNNDTERKRDGFNNVNEKAFLGPFFSHYSIFHMFDLFPSLLTDF
jgi:hypothetical protein